MMSQSTQQTGVVLHLSEDVIAAFTQSATNGSRCVTVIHDYTSFRLTARQAPYCNHLVVLLNTQVVPALDVCGASLSSHASLVVVVVLRLAGSALMLSTVPRSRSRVTLGEVLFRLVTATT